MYALLNVDELPTTDPSVVRQACTAGPYSEATVVAFKVLIWPQCGRPPWLTAAASSSVNQSGLPGARSGT